MYLAAESINEFIDQQPGALSKRNSEPLFKVFKAIVITQFGTGAGLHKRPMEQKERRRHLDSILTNPSSIWSLSSYCYALDINLKTVS